MATIWKPCCRVIYDTYGYHLKPICVSPYGSHMKVRVQKKLNHICESNIDSIYLYNIKSISSNIWLPYGNHVAELYTIHMDTI